jgi:transcriptional regulator with XRE-family HTH domain
VPTIAYKKLMARRATTSRNALATLLGCTTDTLRKIELGLSRPGSATIEKMARVGIEPQDWFVETGSGRTPPPDSTPVAGTKGASR